MKKQSFVRLVALIAVLGLAASACAKKTQGAGGGGGTGGGTKTVEIAYMGALSGDYKFLVQPGYQAAQLAFDEANAGKFGKLPVKIQLVPEDTQGDPTQATSLAQSVGSNSAFVGVIGPAFSGESAAAGKILDQAGIPFVTPSATNPTLAQNGWTHWFRAVGNDDSQGPVGAQYIAKVLKPNCVFIASDGQTYGEGLATVVGQTLKTLGVKTFPQQTIDPNAKSWPALVSRIKASGCTAFYYGGYSAQSGPLRKQMTEAGLANVAMVSGDGSEDSTFLQQAGTAGTGTVATCPCADITSSTDAAAKAFVADYTAKWGTAPGIYSGEAWDIAQMYIAALKAGNTTRSAITTFLHGLNGFQGITKSYTFQPNGELVASSVTIYLYKDENGQWAYLGPSTQVIPSG